MKWMKKGAYIRQVDDETAEKLKAQGFEPFEVAEPKPEETEPKPEETEPKPEETEPKKEKAEKPKK